MAFLVLLAGCSIATRSLPIGPLALQIAQPASHAPCQSLPTPLPHPRALGGVLELSLGACGRPSSMHSTRLIVVALLAACAATAAAAALRLGHGAEPLGAERAAQLLGRWDLANLNPENAAPLTADDQAFSIPVAAVTAQIASMAANGAIPADNVAAVSGCACDVLQGAAAAAAASACCCWRRPPLPNQPGMLAPHAACATAPSAGRRAACGRGGPAGAAHAGAARHCGGVCQPRHGPGVCLPHLPKCGAAAHGRRTVVGGGAGCAALAHARHAAAALTARCCALPLPQPSAYALPPRRWRPAWASPRCCPAARCCTPGAWPARTTCRWCSKAPLAPPPRA